MFSCFTAEYHAEELNGDEWGHGDHGYATEGIYGGVTANAARYTKHEGQDEG